MSTLTSADYTAYKSLSQFETVAEKDEAIRAFLYSHKHELPNSAVAVLKVISRYACKLPGVAFAKIETIAQAAGVSRSSVERAIRALKQAGIIEVRHTVRRRGGQGHSVYVVQKRKAGFPVDVDAPTDVPELKYRQDHEKPRHTSDQQAQQATETKPHETEYSGLSNSKRNNDNDTWKHLPDKFASAVKPFRAIIKPAEAWRKVTLAHRQAAIETDVTADNIVHTAIDAFKATVAAYKTNRIRKDLGGYFFGCLRNVFAVERRREVAESDGMFFNWVSAFTVSSIKP